MSSISCKECYGAMPQSERGGFIDDSMRYLSLHDDHSSLSSFEEHREFLIESPRYNYLSEIKDAPWNLAIIRQTIRKVSRLRNREHLFTDKSLLEVSRITKFFLARLTREMCRFSQKFSICTRNEVYSATQVIFSKLVSRACIGSAYQAYYLFIHSISKNTEKHLRMSKSERSGLTISVGKMFRWMVRNEVAPHVTDSAAIYLAAILEYLVEEVCCLSDATINKKKPGNIANYSILAEDVLPSLETKPDIWRAAQPYEHLCVTRFSDEMQNFKTPAKDMFFQPVRNFMRDDTSSGSVTCFTSRVELASIIERSSTVEIPDTPRHRSVRRRSSPAVMQSANRMSISSGPGIPWNRSAVDVLFEFTKCCRIQFAEDGDPEDSSKISTLQECTPCEDAHPISEWIRLCSVFTKSRLGKTVDADDVKQAARLLIPGCYCPPRNAWPDIGIAPQKTTSIVEEKEFSSESAGSSSANSVFFQLLLEAKDKESRTKHFLEFRNENLDKHDKKGMTLLMYSSLHGNADLCQDLIERKVHLNIRVPLDAIENDCIPATIKGWTALSFAVTGYHTNVVKILLEDGAIPDNHQSILEEDREVLSPLHLAAAAGHFTIFLQLLAKRINQTLISDSPESNMSQNPEDNMQKMHLHALAAAHGHRRTLRKLIAVPDQIEHKLVSRSSTLSLKEVLNDDKEPVVASTVDANKKKLLKAAMYESSEHGYIDIALEIRSLDIPWNYHMWITSLNFAYEDRNVDAMYCLLLDFPEVTDEELSKGIKEYHATLLFEIFQRNLRSSFAQQVASVISLFYGDTPRMEVKCAEEDDTENLPKIGTRFVNNKEMADIIFNIEGEQFFAHKIILQNASRRMEELTKCTNEKGEVNLDGIKYPVFEAAMQFLYSGGVLYQSQPGRVLELLDCAAKLQLVTLKQTCEFESARHMTSYNAVDVYTCSKACKAYQLEKYCYHYFLANLSLMMSRDEFICLLERNQSINGYLEQEFMQAVFGKQKENNNLVIATYL